MLYTKAEYRQVCITLRGGRGILNGFWMVSPLLNLVVILILLDCLVVSLDDPHGVGIVQRLLGHILDLGEDGVGLIVAGVHLGLDDERLEHVQDLGLHDRVCDLFPSLDNVGNSNNSAIHDFIILKKKFIKIIAPIRLLEKLKE